MILEQRAHLRLRRVRVALHGAQKRVRQLDAVRVLARFAGHWHAPELVQQLEHGRRVERVVAHGVAESVVVHPVARVRHGAVRREEERRLQRDARRHSGGHAPQSGRRRAVLHAPAHVGARRILHGVLHVRDRLEALEEDGEPQIAVSHDAAPEEEVRERRIRERGVLFRQTERHCTHEIAPREWTHALRGRAQALERDLRHRVIDAPLKLVHRALLREEREGTVQHRGVRVP